MKKILLLLFLLLAHYQAFAQRNLAVQALNKYVDYCNLTNNYLRILYPELDRFNDALDYTVRKNQQKDDWGQMEREDLLDNPTYWEIFPKTVYNECMAWSKYLPPTDQKLLNEKVSNIRSIIFSIDKHRKDSLLHYVYKKVYLQDFNHGYVILQKIENLIVKYETARADMANTLENIYQQKYKLADTGDYLQSILKAKPAIQLCQKMADDLWKEDSTHLLVDTQKLDSLIQGLEKNKLQYLTKMPNEKFAEHDGANPHLRYTTLTDAMKGFLSHFQSFIKSKSYPYAEWYSKCNYYHNQRIGGTYSLIEDYNLLNILVSGDKFFVIKMDVMGDKAGFTSLRDYKFRSVGINIPERYVLRWIGTPPMYRLRKTSPRMKP